MQKTTTDDAMKILTQMKYPVTKQNLIKAAEEGKADDNMIKQMNHPALTGRGIWAQSNKFVV